MSTVEIKVASVDYAPKVVFGTAFFASAVNGTVGECKFRIRDDDRTISYATGEIIELLIDGDPVWTGYLTKSLRVYAFPAENVVDAGLTRWLDIVGTDLNTLFNKRFVFTVADPTIVFGKLYGPNQPDNTAIADLVADYLDLSGDSLDTSTKIEFVGNINVDQSARAWLAGDSFGQAMASIASLPGAVYFIDPARYLVYTDVNTADAPFGLSDQPDGVTTVGYREMTITRDGSSLANDVLAWGMGYGSTVPVFDRAEDATSEALHGLWQAAAVRSGIYKQDTINRVAESILDGSPSNLRGAKDDKVGVSLVTYIPGFLPAQKVDFTSAVFGFNDVIPIRRMRVTFDAPDTPKYELNLSHAIDEPWGFLDPFLLNLPKLPPLRFPGFVISPPSCWTDGIIDDFNRSLTEIGPVGPPGSTTTPGVASSGYQWTTQLINAGFSSNASKLEIGGDWIASPNTNVPGRGSNVKSVIFVPLDPRSLVLSFPLSLVPITPSIPAGEVGGSDARLVLSISRVQGAGYGSPWTVGTDNLLVEIDSNWAYNAIGNFDESSALLRASSAVGTDEYVWGYPPTGSAEDMTGTLTVTIDDISISANFHAQTVSVAWTATPLDPALTYMRLELRATTADSIVDTAYGVEQVEVGDITASSDLGNCEVPNVNGPIVGSVTSVPAGITYCQTLSRSSSTTCATTFPYTPGSLRVWRGGGLLQRPGTDYTETGIREITFTDALGSSETVQACYLPQAIT